MFFKTSSSVILLLALAACTTAPQSNPARTATEQMLISAAADRAAEKLVLPLPANSRVFIDATNFDGTDSKYAIAAIRTHLLAHGAHVVDDKKKAQTIVELRNGALSTDTSETFVGIPSYSIPIPLTSGSFTTPEVAFYKAAEQQGVAKFAASAYDVKNGSLISAQDPQYGFTHKTKRTLLVFVSWTDKDGLPDEDDGLAVSHEDAAAPQTSKTTDNGSKP